MKYPKNPLAVSNYLNHRRNFLKGGLLMTAGLMLNRPAAAAPVQQQSSQEAQTAPQRSKVAFAAGKDRREMITKVMAPFKEEIQKGIQGKQVIIKPNFVSTQNPLCSTHVDAARAVLDFLSPMYSGKIIIAESPAMGNTMSGFRNYGYDQLEQEYNVSFMDLNTRVSQPFWILDRNLQPLSIQIISEFFDPKNYFISLTRLKTHNSVVATMGLKNIVLGCPLNAGGRNNHKSQMHGPNSRWLHYNMFLVAQQIRPQLTVLDGLEGMQGNGPISGTPVEHGVALAGTDVMAVDSIGAQLMGVPLENLGYLTYCGAAGLGIIDRSNIDIIGNDKPADHIITYELSNNIEQQLEWKQPLNISGDQSMGGGGAPRGGARRGV